MPDLLQLRLQRVLARHPEAPEREGIMLSSLYESASRAPHPARVRYRIAGGGWRESPIAVELPPVSSIHIPPSGARL